MTSPTPSQALQGAASWYGQDMARTGEWVYQLSRSDIDELNAAVRTVRQQGAAIVDLCSESFVLPTLGRKLLEIRDEVVGGRGFALVRGLPVHLYTLGEAAIAFYGTGCHLGWPVPQNAQGHLLGHIRDIGVDPTKPEARLYTTNAWHPYHTDSCDIVGLLCLRAAKRGGLSSVVSSVTIYNEMLVANPDLAHALSEPLYWDRKGEIPAGKRACYPLPVFNHFGGHLSTIYARDFIDGAQRFPDVPRLTSAQVAAMDLLDRLATRSDLRLDMKLEPGDMQFLHNQQVLHSRTGYEDYDEPDRKRHLLRLWLTPPNAWPLPPGFAERYGTVEVGPERGGIRVPNAPRVAPLEPC